MRKHTILIPLDGSAFSRQIIPHILRLFAPEEARLILFHAAPPPEGVLGNPPRVVTAVWPLPMYSSPEDLERAQHPIYPLQIEEGMRANLEVELLPTVHELQGAGYDVAVTIWFGDPATAIAEFVRSEDVDLVALATHGRTGLGQLVLGSVAEQVLRRLAVPILLVRPSGLAGA